MVLLRVFSFGIFKTHLSIGAEQSSKHPIVYFLFPSWILLEEIDSTDGLGRVLLKSGDSCSSNSICFAEASQIRITCLIQQPNQL